MCELNNNTSRTSARRRGPANPPASCQLCSRLVAFRQDNTDQFPDWFNAPVPSFGPANAELLIVGLAPGLKGANKTGRPFTGDYAGDLLYETLLKFGYARGTYQARADDGLQLVNCMITNAVRCVPPQNKPTAAEIKTCRHFFQNQIGALKNLKAVIALGRIAHDTCMTTLQVKKSSVPFQHAAVHTVAGPQNQDLVVIDSYHCSRYNTNTGRLTTEMFHDVFKKVERYAPAR